MRRLICVLLAALSLSAWGAEPDLLSLIGAQIEQHAVVRAQFTQTQHMAALKRPLVTSGRLISSRQYGVVWQIEQPHTMSYVLSEERIVEINADGERRERPLREVPGMAQLNRVLRALMSANPEVLRTAFEVQAHGDLMQWQLELKPRSAQLAQFLSGLQLGGGRFIESIRIVQANGDMTDIRLRHLRADGALSEAELRVLSP